MRDLTVTAPDEGVHEDGVHLAARLENILVVTNSMYYFLSVYIGSSGFTHENVLLMGLSPCPYR
jgi:hypothetical protein